MIGLHPTEVGAENCAALSELKALLDRHSFIAIGEVGLDLYWDKTYKNEQLAVLEEQIVWALERDLPLVIHSREAFTELYNLFSHYKDTPIRGVFHSFTGTADEAHSLLEFPGFMLGINGVVTFKKSTLPDILPEVPLSRLVVETDSPYLAPTPFRGKRNESAYVLRVVDKLAEIYGMTPREVSSQTSFNASSLFGLSL
jgi:TatD DNase family protein